MVRFSTVFALCGVLACAPGSFSQSSSSSSSPSPAPAPAQVTQGQPQLSSSRPRVRQAQTAGAGITLESDEALFEIAAALNVCGYDADLKDSEPVRAAVRADLAEEYQASALVRQDQAALCNYIELHKLADRGRDLAQYVSLALYVSPPPEMEPTADQTQMPPDALQVVNMLPLLRKWAQSVSLHPIWVKHRPEYDAITDKLHDPITRMILNTNIYVKIPVSGYDGRSFQILIEPMLSPAASNARIYANDFTIVSSPTAAGAIPMGEIRHLYLHFAIEPLVYANASSMTRLTPLLKPVANAPLEYIYKTDVVALVTECMIKAIEARTMDVGFPPPPKPTGVHERSVDVRYTEEMKAYERSAEAVRRRQVALDMRQGWVLTDYFYDQMIDFEHSPVSLKENMGQMVYGMDVEQVRHQAQQVQFLPVGSGEFVRRAPAQPTGMQLAEKMMLEGRLVDAEALADKALADPAQNHADALYVKARISLMEDDPKDSFEQFEQVLKTSESPHTTAWAHIYLGRLYDIKVPAERGKAVAEYKAAMSVPGVQPDAEAAAQAGLNKAFTVPKIVHEEEDDTPVDPSGKAEKQAYKPDAPDSPSTPK